MSGEPGDLARQGSFQDEVMEIVDVEGELVGLGCGQAAANLPGGAFGLPVAAENPGGELRDGCGSMQGLSGSFISGGNAG